MSDITRQFINLGPVKITEDTPIYRVFPKLRLLQMFRNKKLTLVRPELWEDPFENFLAKCPAEFGNTGLDVSIAPLFRNFYGQCWTLKPESDAMWRIYSHRKNGARVSTTVGRLFRAIHDPANGFAHMSYYIGAVAYKTDAEIREVFEDSENATAAALDSTGRGQAIPLFVKRPEFEHEEEVRLIYRFNQENHRDQHPAKIWQFDIDPNALFDDVLFDPRLDHADFCKGQKQLQKLGFTKPIKQSTLYQVPNLRIKVRIR